MLPGNEIKQKTREGYFLKHSYNEFTSYQFSPLDKGRSKFWGFQFFIEAAIFIITHQRMEKMVRAHEAVAKRLLQSVNY